MDHNFLSYLLSVTHVGSGGCFSIINMAATNILMHIAFLIT